MRVLVFAIALAIGGVLLWDNAERSRAGLHNVVRLSTDQPHASVIAMLGVPSWVHLASDPPDVAAPAGRVEVLWRREGCAPVRVIFRNDHVSGWAIPQICGAAAEVFTPDDTYSCADPRRAPFCR